MHVLEQELPNGINHSFKSYRNGIMGQQDNERDCKRKDYVRDEKNEFLKNRMVVPTQY